MPDKKSSAISGVLAKPVPSWALVLIFLVGIGLGFGAFWLARSQKPAPAFVVTPPADQLSVKPPSDVPLPPTSTSSGNDQVASSTTPERNDLAEYVIKPIEDKAVLEIKWTKPVKRDPSAVFSGVLESNRNANINDYSTVERLDEALTQLVSETRTKAASDMGTWELGMVSAGRYKGYRLYEQREGISEMGASGDFRFLIDSEGKRMLIMSPLDLELMKYYRKEQPMGAKTYMEWEKVVTPAFGLSLDPRYSMLDSQTIKGRELEGRTYLWWDTAYIEWLTHSGDITGRFVVIAKTDQGLNVYSDKESPGNGCILIQRQDGYFESFASRLKPMPEDGIGELTIDVKWDQSALAGRAPSKSYVPTTGTCDSFCPLLVDEKENLNADALVKIGTGPDDQPLYAPKDMANSFTVKQLYETWFLPDGKTKPSFEEFLKQKPIPVFFWKDSFGRWVKFNDYDLQPPGECGKPVIYLYPEKTTPISVALPKFIDVTVSEPTYPDTGWSVIAHPDGSLDYTDGKTYGSLYWEGVGVDYRVPKTGFVVKDGQQEAFLKDILPKYGLNEKESKEFMEFWLPQMKGAPYYRVSFLTEDWNKAAPLYVAPKPQTYIRIFMDWQKLSGPMDIAAPEVVTPVRQGFTLVEWGGLLH